MTLLHQLRRSALRMGLDVQRASATAPARLVRLLRSRGVTHVLDVGANQGQYAERLRRYGYGGSICSFEPLPGPYAALARCAASDTTWFTHQVALGASDGRVQMNVAGNDGAASSSVLPMLRRHEIAMPEASYIGSVEVAMKRLDDIWDDVVPRGVSPFLKMDVQGYEGAVLDGASRVLDQVLGLQLEISLVPLYAGALSLRDVLDRSEELGMEFVHVEPGFVDLRTDELLQCDGVFLRPPSR
jgi:FkbM family methyltransferase